MMILSLFAMSLPAYGDQSHGNSGQHSGQGNRPYAEGKAADPSTSELEGDNDSNKVIEELAAKLNTTNQVLGCAGYEEPERSRCEQMKTGEVSAL